MDPQLIYIAFAVLGTGATLWLALGRRTPTDDDGPSMANVKRYLREGNKDKAITEYRTLTGADLAEATAFVQSLPGATRP